MSKVKAQESKRVELKDVPLASVTAAVQALVGEPVDVTTSGAMYLARQGDAMYMLIAMPLAKPHISTSKLEAWKESGKLPDKLTTGSARFANKTTGDACQVQAWTTARADDVKDIKAIAAARDAKSGTATTDPGKSWFR